MNTEYVKRAGAQSPLNISLIETTWKWPSKDALEKAAEWRDAAEVAEINRDLELFSRTRLKSCRVVKLLRDAIDAAWELENASSETFNVAC